MTRRELLEQFGIAIAASGALSGAPATETLGGTQQLTLEGDLADKLHFIASSP